MKNMQSLYETLSYFRSYIANFTLKVSRISALLYERADLKWIANHIVIVNGLLEEVRMHKRLQVPQSDVPFTLDVDIEHDGYGGIL